MEQILIKIFLFLGIFWEKCFENIFEQIHIPKHKQVFGATQAPLSLQLRNALQSGSRQSGNK